MKDADAFTAKGVVNKDVISKSTYRKLDHNNYHKERRQGICTVTNIIQDSMKNKEENSTNHTLYSYYELGAWTTQLIFQRYMSQSSNYKHVSFDESMCVFIKRINSKLQLMDINFFVNDINDISFNLLNDIIDSFNEPQKYNKKYSFLLGENIMFWLMENTIDNNNFNSSFKEKICISLKALNIDDRDVLECFDTSDYQGDTKEEYQNFIQKKFNYFNGLIEMILNKNSLFGEYERKNNEYEYDVALSFAGEDREYVDKIAVLLKNKGVKVFYDKMEVSNLFGKDLYQYLSYIYKDAAKFCLIFLSRAYKEKAWTGHELKNAQNRAFKENKEYILPVYLEEVQIDGLLDTIGHLKTSEYSIAEIVDITIEKINGTDNVKK